MFDHQKDAKQMTFLFDWMRLARKPNFNLHQDIKLLFELISIPITESQLKIIEKEIDPKGIKTQLSKDDLLTCFAAEQECRKPQGKQLLKAFKYITGDQDDLSFEDLKSHFLAENIDPITTDLILKQLCQYETKDGRFDFQTFTNSIY